MTTYATVLVVLTYLTLVVSLVMLATILLLIIVDECEKIYLPHSRSKYGLVILTKIQNPRTIAYWRFALSTTL